MEITNDIKTRILVAIQADRQHYPSDSRHAKVLGISGSVYNALKQGKTDRQLSDASWLTIARKLGIALRPEAEWIAVETDTYAYISGQLSACQDGAMSVILCDRPNIGKTYTARLYAQQHTNVALIDCSQVKTKRRLVRAIASAFGVDAQGRYDDVYKDLVYYLQSIPKPLVILDEAGDLQFEAFLELKALWNATEYCCGWYMMGADGLKAKINRSIECAKVGYAEIFSRYGGKYSRATPENEAEYRSYALSEVTLVARANCPNGIDPKQLARQAQGLRRLHNEVMKLRLQAQ